MEFFNKYKGVSLIIDDSLLNKLEQIGIQSFPNECGGFLIGYYSEDFMKLYITDYLLPIKQQGFTHLFERSIEGISHLFKALFTSKKHYYIGEWHTHPNGSSMYSQTDLNAMKQIAECDTVTITNPVLLILSIGREKMKDFSIYIFDNKGLHRYE